MIPIADYLLQPKQDEYLGPEGLLYCKRCGTKRQQRTRFLGEDRVVGCRCKCQAEAARKAEEARRAMELRDRIQRCRNVGIADAALRKATFDEDAYHCPEMDIARRYVDNWQQMSAKGMGLLIWGDVGTGKTFLAACIANALLDRGVSVMVTSFGRILGGMPGVATGEQNQYLDSFRAYDLLVLDDLGAERDTEYATEQVYRVVDDRYRANQPMIFTTNLTPKLMKAPESFARERIYDRVLERCMPLKVNRRQLRKENAADNLEWMQEILKG